MNHFKEVLEGIHDSCRYDKTLKVLMKCPEVRVPLYLSIFFTGCVFLGSALIDLIIFEKISKLHPIFLILKALFSVFWVYPIYILCFILNIFTYNDISLCVYKISRGVPKSPALSLSRAIAHEVHRSLIMGIYAILISLLALVPYSQILIISLLSWLYSFYCFEYRWILEGKTINKRIKKLEGNSLYYLGFGIPFALSTYSFPVMVGNGLWLFLFPLFMVTAILSNPPQVQSVKLPIFEHIHKLCDTFEVFILGKK